MKIDIQRKIDRIAGSVICRIFSLFYRKKNNSSTEVRPKRILTILLSEMGSLVLAYPTFGYLKEKFPGVEIYALLFNKNREVLGIMNVIPSENILTVDDSSLLRFLKDSIVVILKMRKIKFDAVVDCELFARVSSIFSYLSGAPIRAGFHPHTQEGLYRGDFITRPVLYNPYHHMSQQFLTLVDSIDSIAIPTVKRRIVEDHLTASMMTVEQLELKSMNDRLHKDFRDISGKKLVLIYPGGGLLPIRAWPLPNFCDLANDLIRRGYAVAVIGLETDKKLAVEISSHCKSSLCIDLTGYTKTIRELMLIFHLSSLLITNDGGPGHFASMTPIPTIIFYGPETPTLYGPLDDKALVFYVPLSCSPCLTAYNQRESPCDGDNKCLQHIDKDEVMKKAIKILEGSKKRG